MGRLIPLMFLADVALMIVALIDCLSSDESGIRALPKIIWVFLILLFSPIGPIVWFVAGRPATSVVNRRVWAPGSGFPERDRPRPRAPDDDPEFLRSISKQHREDTDLLRRWEADLRRREEDLRRREQDDKPADG